MKLQMARRAALALAVGGVIAVLLGRSLLSRQTAGVDEMIGMIGRVEAPIGPGRGRRGKIFVHGEYWNAEAEEAIAAGESVAIEAVEGLTVRVKRVERSG